MNDAQKWIGEATAKDRLSLDQIKKGISDEAGALREILDDEKVSGLLRMRSEASTLASNAQNQFRRLSIAAVLATALATLTSGLLLYDAGSEPSAPPSVSAQQAAPTPTAQPPAVPAAATKASLVRWVDDYRVAIVVMQTASLFVSAVAAALLASLGLVGRWTENRNKAELLRRDVFNEVVRLAQDKIAVPLAAPDPRNPISQVFEFFRRYQHDLQIRYYTDRLTRHERAAAVLSWLTAILAGLAAITGVVGALGGVGMIVSAFLGIAVPILLSAAQSWRATSGDGDKAAAYRKARDALEQLRLKLGDVRKQAELGDAVAVRAYVDGVHLIMTTENAEWTPAKSPAKN
jgi:ABC-type multidrug transport system fused ATPase/permease subunit